MAKACGLRIGPRRFELFVLDGSPKNPKILTSLAGEIPPDELDPVGAAARALKRTLKAHKIPRENLAVVIDARAGAFRRVNLPIADPAKIESVIKFEVEAQLPQFSIDDVVVDFYVQESTSDSSSLLVTAVPKDEIANAIRICEGAGIEPLDVEVETTALVNGASAAGLCGIDSAQVLVHVGEESTAVAVIDGGRVREMRVIQIGALSHTPNGTPPSDEGDEEELDDEETLAEAPPIEGVAEIVQRLRRELSRTVSGARTANELDGIYLCGFDLPGLVGFEIQGISVQAFEAFEIAELEGGVHSEYRSGAVAFGAAFGQLGGGIIHSSLRREELRFTGAFERVELPLAVLCLLVATFLGVWYLFLDFERQRVDAKLAYMLNSSVNYMIGDVKSGKGGNLDYPPENLKKYVKETTGVVPGSNPARYQVDPEKNPYEQLLHIRMLLTTENGKLKKQLGHESDLTQPQSALKGLTLVLDLLAQGGERYGRLSFRGLDANYQTRSGKQDSVKVDLSLSFFAETATQATRNYEAFFADVQKQPWFVEPFRRPDSEAFEGVETGVFLPNFTVTVNTAAATEEQS